MHLLPSQRNTNTAATLGISMTNVTVLVITTKGGSSKAVNRPPDRLSCRQCGDAGNEQPGRSWLCRHRPLLGAAGWRRLEFAGLVCTCLRIARRTWNTGSPAGHAPTVSGD